MRIQRASKKVHATIVPRRTFFSPQVARFQVIPLVGKNKSGAEYTDSSLNSKRANLVFNSPWRKLAIKASLGFHSGRLAVAPHGTQE